MEGLTDDDDIMTLEELLQGGLEMVEEDPEDPDAQEDAEANIDDTPDDDDVDDEDYGYQHEVDEE